MTQALSQNSIYQAIDHLSRYGDTDIFPNLHEIEFLRHRSDVVVEALSKLQLGQYQPRTAIETLSPKNSLGFRLSHQLGLTDTVLLLSALIEVGDEIEAARIPPNFARAFSYRFKLGDDGEIFRAKRTFRDWISQQIGFLENSKNTSKIIKTDITDFYQRIFFHRLEGLLENIDGKQHAVRLIIKIIKRIRTRESFGLPVGGNPARLLAELALTDVDSALKDEGIRASRFVDDFVIFLNDKQDSYEILAFLAEALAQEGLSLNASKTRVFEKSAYLANLRGASEDVFDAAQQEALEILSESLYLDDQPDPDEVAELQSLNLFEMLGHEFNKEDWDFGKIRRILRAIRLVDPEGALSHISDNLTDMLPFSKEIVLILGEIGDDEEIEEQFMSGKFISAVCSPLSRTLPLIRSWLLEVFIRGILPFSAADLKKIESSINQYDRRYVDILRGKLNQRTYFRGQKKLIDDIGSSQIFPFLIGSTCLPKDELSKFYPDVVTHFKDPLLKPFCDWLLDDREKVLGYLETTNGGG